MACLLKELFPLIGWGQLRTTRLKTGYPASGQSQSFPIGPRGRVGPKVRAGRAGAGSCVTAADSAASDGPPAAAGTMKARSRSAPARTATSAAPGTAASAA